jgi:hypothetical protein
VPVHTAGTAVATQELTIMRSIELRINRAVINNIWTMNRAFTIVCSEAGLYLLYTGPAVRISTHYTGQGLTGGAAAAAANAVVAAGIRRIETAEARVTPTSLDALSAEKHSAYLAWPAISTWKYRQKSGFFSPYPALELVSANKKRLVEFPYSPRILAEQLRDMLRARCSAAEATA